MYPKCGELPAANPALTNITTSDMRSGTSLKSSPEADVLPVSIATMPSNIFAINRNTIRTAVNTHQMRFVKLLDVARRLKPAPAAKTTLATEIVFGETPRCAKNVEMCCEYWLFRAEIGLLSEV